MQVTVCILWNELTGALLDHIYTNHKAARQALRQLNKQSGQEHIIKQITAKEYYNAVNTNKRNRTKVKGAC